MSAPNQQDLRRTLGFALIVVGVLLLTVGLVIMNTPIHCPANGCPPDYLLQLSLEGFIPFVSGIVLIIIGVILIISSRKRTDYP